MRQHEPWRGAEACRRGVLAAIIRHPHPAERQPAATIAALVEGGP